MTAGTLADLDPVGVVNGWLLTHPRLTAEFTRAAGDDPPGTVVGVVAAPYPCLRVVESPGGTLRNGVWVVDPELIVEAWDDEAGTHGQEALRRLLMVALDAVRELTEREHAETDPVVTDFRSGGPMPLPDADGQPRYLAVVTLTMHPPRVAPG